MENQPTQSGGQIPAVVSSDLLGSEIYVLLADGDGTMRSVDEPFGVAVTTEAEAKRFVKDGGVGYTHSYAKLRIFSDKDAAIAWKYPKEPNRAEVSESAKDKEQP